MLGKRTHPMMGRLSELLVSGNRAGFLEIGTTPSPRSPLEYKIQSPRGLKNYYDIGGVGLGIVAALEKSTCDGGHEILAKYAICSANMNMNRSDPIPVNSGKKCERYSYCKERERDQSLENFTYVTSHGPDNKSLTKLYYDDHGNHRIGFHVIKEALPLPPPPAAKFSDGDVSSLYPTSDFLSSCHLCKKKLHGRDIYMYRGEKAFCSVECRSRQMMIDERKEQCRSEIARSADVSSSPYTTSPIFSTGILAI
ncbi:hypothetical protein JCGZ_07514 [Jatropha curcas]|uniref:FLZ-type domain-containing protein n=1 Tax=Jatropha curcas TaxID=180498 RepID=A0A067KG10_JATCU|nr:FCS-Like Zinc finger 13 [Jatropha curcas]KDP33943.1 hypothetical protein JCGZ_07514 [Jatropha curcas]